MNTKIKIAYNLKTKTNPHFAALNVSCTHEYYNNPICPDLSLELPLCTKKLLEQHNIYFKLIENELYLGKKDSKQINEDLPSSFPLILIKIKVNNSRFWTVTDKSDFPKEGHSLIFKTNKNQLFKQINKSYSSNISDLNKAILNKNKEGKNKSQSNLNIENIVGIPARELATLPSLDLPTLLTIYDDILIDFKEQYYFFSDSPNLLGIALLDLSKVENKSSWSIPFKARLLKLKYRVKQKELKPKKNGLKLADILEEGNQLTELVKNEEDLKFDIRKEENEYIIESKDKWKLTERNSRTTPNFFNMEADNAGGKKNFTVLLPFPKNINSHQIKSDCLEQDIQKLRFQQKT